MCAPVQIKLGVCWSFWLPGWIGTSDRALDSQMAIRGPIGTAAFFALFAVVKDAEYLHGSARWLQYQSAERRFIKFGRNRRFDLRAAIQPA